MRNNSETPKIGLNEFGVLRAFRGSDNSDTESESESSTDDLTAGESLTEGAKKAKFLCSLFARFGTTNTSGFANTCRKHSARDFRLSRWSRTN
ncbi:MAG: hypothetical protein QOH31_3114 [Verrucomicrobiota bacterium]